MNLFLSIPEVRQNLYYKRKSSRITYRERFPLSRVVHFRNLAISGILRKAKTLYIMSLYSLYSILFLTFTVVFIIGFLFVSCCKNTKLFHYFAMLF